MSRKRYKSTGCARFFVVLLILIPLAYFGARLIRGGEGIPAIDNYIESIFDGDTQNTDTGKSKNENDEIYILTKENEDLRTRIEDLESEVEELKSTIEQMRNQE